MPAVSTQSALALMYKKIYKGRDLSNASKRKTPLGKKIAVKNELYGDNLTYPIRRGLGWGVGRTMDATNPGPKSGIFSNWVVTTSTDTVKLYGKVTVDNPSVMRAARDVGSFMRLTQKEIQDTLDNMTMIRYGNELWSDGAGDIAQVLAVTGSDPATSFTLTNYEDAIKFDGSGKQVIQTSTARTGGAVKSTTWQVDKVERYTSAGVAKITVTRLTGSGAGNDPAANDYVYLLGTYGNGPKGIPAWIPTTTPSATAFFGVDRSAEPEILAGFRGTWEGTIADSAAKLVSVMSAYFEPDATALWVSPYRWYQLQFELQAKNLFMLDNQRTLEWGTTAMSLITPSGVVPVLADPYCPAGAGYLLNHGQMEFLTTGPMIHAADEDVAGLRLSDDDGLEYRFRSLSCFRMDTPHKCGVFPISQS
jgi:hypothetical protein